MSDEKKKLNLSTIIKTNSADTMAKIDKLMSAFEKDMSKLSSAEMEAYQELKYELKMNDLETKQAIKEKEIELFTTYDSLKQQKKSDNILKKVFTWFTFGGFVIFAGIRVYLSYLLLTNQLAGMNEFALMTFADISTLFTAILFTIKDYLFGSSSSSGDYKTYMENRQVGSVSNDPSKPQEGPQNPAGPMPNDEYNPFPPQ